MKKIFFFSVALFSMMSLVSCDKNKQDEPAQPTTKEVTSISGTLLFYTTAAADKYCTVTIQQSTDGGKTYTNIDTSTFTKRAADSSNPMDVDFKLAAPLLTKACWTTCYQSKQPITLTKEQKAYYAIKLERNSTPVVSESEISLYMGAGISFYNAGLGDLPAYTVEIYNTKDKYIQYYANNAIYKTWSEETVTDALTALATKTPSFYILFHGYTTKE